ncbi:MAG: D-alanyl-D-alanine carboxypeptidase family protein [Bacteroidales bacterium]|nr:D-alanyl-D-alanine carboxypeptidase family protein [Bacteroidales bacterium]
MKFYLNYLSYKLGIRERISKIYISNIHVRECYEPLVDLVKHPKIFLNDATLEHPVLLRKSVAMKLYKVADKLPEGVCLKVYSAFRSRIAIYNVWKQEEERMTKENPQMNRAELLNLVNSKVSSPKANMGGHDTGAAVDIALCDVERNDLDFGTKVHETHNNGSLTKEQKANRKMLKKFMKSQKFVNDPTRWWHFSYGDKSWSAYNGKRNGAIYGAVEKEFENIGYVSVIKTEIKSVNIK